MEFRDRVIEWLGNGCEFAKAVDLLNIAIENTYYRDNLIKRGERPDNIAAIRYELIKAAKLTKQEVATLPEKVRDLKPKTLPLKPKETATPEAKENAVKLRETFPFLNDKDCPDKFKILVADMITSYRQYVEGHKRLFDCKDLRECYEVASDIIENYVNNRQSWDELKYYQKHSKILGVNKLFKHEVWEREIKAKPTGKLIEDMKHYTNRIWRNKKSIQDEPDSTANDDRRQRIEEYEVKLEMIKKHLKI